MTRMIVRTVPTNERKAYLNYLKLRIPHLEICTDLLYDFPIPGQEKSMRNMIEVFHMATRDPFVHLEDDIILTRDFIRKIETQIAAMPNTVIQFFSMRSADLTVGSRWDNSYMMAQCTYFPFDFAPGFIDHYASWNYRAQQSIGSDTMVQRYLRARKIKYWIHVPSLVQHREATSAIDVRRSRKRQSISFVDPDL